MNIRRSKKNKISYSSIYILIALLIIILCMIIFIPSWSSKVSSSAWDGVVATSFSSGNGTEENPYIISNASEFAYFSEMLKTTNYENTYFKLINNIVINAGVFNYDTVDGVKYTIANNTYYVDYYSNKYYDNVNRYGTSIGEVNIFNPINNF